MKCRLKQCKASCCYNVPFRLDFFDEHKDKIVNKVENLIEMGNGFVLPYTTTFGEYTGNKCPFLRSDYLCNIYDDRPDVCRRMGEINELKCIFRK
ncbi:MAG: YkgJ family cysteine cluster protein [Bacteroidales bacterium]|nr:YkgJ family cysteine cluster protein [Bacteroidales bacterium]